MNCFAHTSRPLSLFRLPGVGHIEHTCRARHGAKRNPERPEVAGCPLEWSEWMNLRTNLSWIYEGGVLPKHQRGNFSPEHMGAWLIKRGTVFLREETRP
jgi:hypothetical protein